MIWRFLRHEPSLSSIKQKPLESRRVRTQPFTRTRSVDPVAWMRRSTTLLRFIIGVLSRYPKTYTKNGGNCLVRVFFVRTLRNSVEGSLCSWQSRPNGRSHSRGCFGWETRDTRRGPHGHTSWRASHRCQIPQSRQTGGEYRTWPQPYEARHSALRRKVHSRPGTKAP